MPDVQIPFQPPETTVNGFFESIEEMWNKFWIFFTDFITGKNCRCALLCPFFSLGRDAIFQALKVAIRAFEILCDRGLLFLP